jgi:ADP-ribose pyrophosphatase
MSWKVLKTTPLFSSGVFSLRSDRCQLPDGRVMDKYYVMEFPDWVNVLPVLPDGDLLLIDQYRHASGLSHLEIPGGSMDPGSSETPEQAARRELLEETGFDSNEIVPVFSHYPNPALQNNQMHTFIAFNCTQVQEPTFDEFEDLSAHRCSLSDLQNYLEQGRITHSLMIASILLAMPLIKKRLKSP